MSNTKFKKRKAKKLSFITSQTIKKLIIKNFYTTFSPLFHIRFYLISKRTSLHFNNHSLTTLYNFLTSLILSFDRISNWPNSFSTRRIRYMDRDTRSIIGISENSEEWNGFFEIKINTDQLIPTSSILNFSIKQIHFKLPSSSPSFSKQQTPVDHPPCSIIGTVQRP